MMKYELIIFDLDGTLADRGSDLLYPDAAAWLATHLTQPIAIATNQGGVGLRYWMETEGFGNPEAYPSESDVIRRLDNLLDQFPGEFPSVQFCYAYQSKKTGQWGPSPVVLDGTEWMPGCRKPSPGMLIAAIEDWGVDPGETLMVGDGEEDRLAAEAAGCHFMWAWEFFGRELPGFRE